MSMLRIFAFLLIEHNYITGASAANGTSTVETTGWRSEPPERGTFRLLISCIVTLSLCVYTALHLNLPSPGSSASAVYMKKTWWVLLGIFAPELVVYTAWGQWNSARRLTTRIEEILQEQKRQGSSHANRKNDWTMVHSFYAGMGGFAIQTNEPVQPKYIPGSPQLSVTAHGIAILAEHGHLPDVPESFIEDKSKADDIAKFLAIVQAGWLLVQCIARVVTHLPLTFLEIITSAHVICALLMYLLWMKKPYDIHEPHILTGEWVRPLCAAMWMFSRISALKHKEGRYTFYEWPEIERMIQINTQGVPESNEAGRQHPKTADRTIPASAQVNVGTEDPAVEYSSRENLATGDVVIELGNIQPAIDGDSNSAIAGYSTIEHVQILNMRTGEVKDRSMVVANPVHSKLLRDEVVHQLGLGPKPENHHYDKRITACGDMPKWIKPSVELDLDCITLTRWKLMLSVVRANQPIWDRYKTTYYREDAPFLAKYTISEYPARLVWDNLIDTKIKNWPGKELLGQRNDMIPIAILSLATALYGGVHAAAWYEYFPSSSERHLWRFSAAFIAGSGVTWSVVSVIWEKMPRFDVPKHWLDLIIFLFSLLIYTASLSAALIYLFARAFLVFEALYSLRQLPVAAYQTPVFTQYLPHL